VSAQTISATLGTQFFQQSLPRGRSGSARDPVHADLLPDAGVIASFALIYYTLVVLAIFRFILVTLTLAGIAGFVLSIGMAVDANILIFGG
jgi:preprotein translocase subunit SecD